MINELENKISKRIVFRKSGRAKNIRIAIRAFKPIFVTVPTGVSFRQAERFVDSKMGWIAKNAAKVAEIEKRQLAASAGLEVIDREQARNVLAGRLNFLAQKYEFSYNRVFIRNQKTRWGSCSGVNNINLNVNLMRLPRELVDYVLLHELVHTKIKNHSRDFWRELDKYTGGKARELARRMKEFHIPVI